MSVHPDLLPEDERTALVQRLDFYRGIVAATLLDVPWDQASMHVLPSTDMTIGGIVQHLAWAEDRWFQGRLLGVGMPPPWNEPGADDPDHSIRLSAAATSASVLALYTATCDRSRSTLAACESLDQVAVVPSFGIGPVNVRWILVHMIDETARHVGHLDLLRDALNGPLPSSDAAPGWGWRETRSTLVRMLASEPLGTFSVNFGTCPCLSSVVLVSRPSTKGWVPWAAGAGCQVEPGGLHADHAELGGDVFKFVVGAHHGGHGDHAVNDVARGGGS